MKKAILGALTGLTLVLAGCGGKAESEKNDEPAAKAKIAVHTAVIETANFDDTVKVYGRVEANEMLNVQTEMMGRIEALPYDEGDRIKAGNTLVRINARQALAQKKQADAQLHQAQTELTRTEKLVAKKLATPQQLDGQKAQVEMASAGVELAAVMVSRAVIRSPISGQVTNVQTTVGALASPGMPLLHVVDIDTVEVVADVPEKDIALIEKDSEVSVHVEAFNDEAFTGKISEVGLMANSATRTFPVKIRIQNSDHRLRPGMLCWLDLRREAFQGAVVVPRDAIIDDVTDKTAYLKVGDVAKQRTVVLGPSRGRFVVVRSGIQAGDELVVLGHRQLVDGQAVAVKSKKNCCAAQLQGNRPDALKAEPGRADTNDADDDNAEAQP